jgi:nicotinamidase-related amidase
MNTIAIDPLKTALVLIDLQQGIVERPCAAHTAADVVRNAARLGNKFRARLI